MKIVDTKMWKKIRKNKWLYFIIHNSIGKIVSEKKMKKRVESMKKRGLSSLFSIQTALEKEELLFFVDFGTLLGFVREGKPLSWDYDMDFGLLIDDDQKWDILNKAMNNIGFEQIKQFSYKKVITEKTYRKDDVYVDFFRHFSLGDTSCYYVYYAEKDYEYKDENQLHARMTKTVKISGTKELEVEDGKVYVPNEYIKYLEDVFGADWKVPNPNWTAKPTDNIFYLEEFGVLEEYEK